jgi:hypothetical protein
MDQFVGKSCGSFMVEYGWRNGLVKISVHSLNVTKEKATLILYNTGLL